MTQSPPDVAGFRREPGLFDAEALGYRVRRLDRTFDERYAIDLERFARLTGQA